MTNNPNNPQNETSPPQKSRGWLIWTLTGVLIALIVIIILLLLRSCDTGDDGTGTTTTRGVSLDPDYAIKSEDTNAESIPNDPSTSPPEVSHGGGSMTFSFKDQVTYSLSTGKISLFFQNPGASTHNVVAQMILVRGDDQYLLAESGILKPGYQVTSMTADENAPELSVGGYNGKIRLLFYDPVTGERAIVDTDIPCTITVTE